MSRRQAILNPKGTTCSAKRFVSRKHDEVTSELNAVFLDVVPGPKVRCAFDVAATLRPLRSLGPGAGQAGRLRGQVPSTDG